MVKRLARLARLLIAAEQAHLDDNDDAALILLYAFLDVLGTATKVLTDGNGNGPAFRRWVDEYVLSATELGVSSEDIWGARCGMLHSLSHESDRSRQGKAKVILYVRGEETTDSGLPWAAAIQQATAKVPGISKVPVDRLAVVHLGTLLRAVRVGFNRFTDDVVEDAELDNRITQQMDAALTVISVTYS
jgi:hypothetical protein